MFIFINYINIMKKKLYKYNEKKKLYKYNENI